MNYSVKHPSKKLEGSITLPASKSISNRALIIQALCSKPFQIHNLSEAKDTRILQEVLQNTATDIYVGDAGTAMRFLTAFLSTQKGPFIIDGSKRMRERPIQLLVDALNQLDANISYLEKEGFPPLHIAGHIIQGGAITLDGGVSSQYISALLLISPTLEKGLTIHLRGTLVSKPYIEMTLSMMAYFGVESEWKGNCITIKQQSYQAKDLTIETDWSAAAFWLELVALAKEANIILQGPHSHSWQGDQSALALFAPLGIRHEFTPEGLLLQKAECITDENQYNLLSTPDLAQALCCTLAGLNKQANISGLQTLGIKETDRLAALQQELAKFSVQISIDKQSIRIGSASLQTPDASLASYNDHRMAMCLAPLALKTEGLIIQDVGVVDKSYPTFWEDLKKVGFKITPVTDSSR